MIDRSAATIEDLYDLMCRYLRATGWTRQDETSGWWWKEDAPEGEATIGPAVEQQFDLDGLDTRAMRMWEPYEFWPPEEDESGECP